MKSLAFKLIAVLSLSLTSVVALAGQNSSTQDWSNIEFVRRIFTEDNLGPKLPGGIRMIKDERKVEVALKRTLPGNVCDKDFNGGWQEMPSVAIKAAVNSSKTDGRIRIFHNVPCEGAYSSSVAMIRPSASVHWYLVPDFMNNVDSARTYGQWGTGDTSLVILGYNDWDGGGEDPSVIHISLVDDKTDHGVKATQLNLIALPTWLGQ